LAALGTAPVLTLDVRGLQPCRVTQQDAHQVDAHGVCVDRPAEAAPHKQRQPAAMVQVCVTEDHRVDCGGIKWQRQGVAGFFLARALEQAAVQQQLVLAAAQVVARAGDFAGGAVAGQFQDLPRGCDPQQHSDGTGRTGSGCRLGRWNQTRGSCMSRYFAWWASIALALVSLALALRWPGWWWGAGIFGALALVGAVDLLQRRSTLRRNYPLLAHFRYGLES